MTITLDFPMLGVETLRLLDELDGVVAEAGAALYPAKDVRMAQTLFRHGTRLTGQFVCLADPVFPSDFWHGVTS